MRPEVCEQLSEILFDPLEVKDAIAYALYYSVNPNSNMCVPNCSYELAEKMFKKWRDSYKDDKQKQEILKYDDDLENCRGWHSRDNLRR